MTCDASSCGWDCTIFLDGECPIANELVSDDTTGEQMDLLFDLYNIEDSKDWF